MVELCWPTPNHNLFATPEKFFAHTRANPDYGRPGWTRDCGRRFHRGCDIVPVRVRATGKFVTVLFSDCATGREYPGTEPALVCDDEVFAVFDGRVRETCEDESASDFGLHVVLEHRWPAGGKIFFTFYGHLARVDVRSGDVVRGGQQIGVMGQTSRIADARNWMAVAPHLHFEARDENNRPFNPEEFLRALLPPNPAV